MHVVGTWTMVVTNAHAPQAALVTLKDNVSVVLWSHVLISLVE